MALQETLESMHRKNRRGGFTLMEIMIVVMIIVILLEISVPNFLRARATGQRNTCISNLKHIDAAKEEWAMDTGAPQGAAVLMSDIAPDFLSGPATGPTCPAGGSYRLNAVGVDPTCTLSAAPSLHVLP